MSKNSSEERERLPLDDEVIRLTHSGNSRVLTIPAHWLRALKELKREPLLFYAHIEKDDHGRLYLVFQKARTSPPELEV